MVVVVVVVVVFLEVLGVLLVVLRSEPLVPVGVALMPARPSRLLLVVVLLLLSVVPPISAEDDEDEEGAVMTTDVGELFSSADPVFATVRRGSTFVVTGLDRAAVEEKDCAPPRSFRGGSGCSVLLLREEEEEDGKTAADISNGLVRLTAPHDRNVPSSSSTTHIVFVVIVIVISTVVACRWVLLCCYSIRFDLRM